MNSKHDELDEFDKAIIRCLQIDGRRAYADIASELGLSPSTVQQRANRLMERNLLRVRAVTDPIKMGVPVVAAIALEVDGSIIREVADQIAAFPEVGYVVICAGSYDIQLEVACRDNDHLLNVISAISKINGVRSTQTFIYLKIIKNFYQWGV
ncbi:MAG: Lrp/AsnC family transcriptional regulator [Anaerolineales bacterium]|nr:Lrp/AsnC family transcriptional regulator [Anaerolineales bacterium]